MTDNPPILFAGGGTGGHLYPGVAVAQELKRFLPNTPAVFLCTTRAIDQIILEPTGFEAVPQPIVPPEKSVGGLLRFWKAWRETKDQVTRLLKDRKPALVLGLGGYAAGVAVKLASERKIPTALINPDVIPGKANLYLMKFVKQVYCQFAQTSEHVPTGQKSKLVVTGCPIRSELEGVTTRKAAIKNLGLDPVLQTLVVTGASQGAKTVNEGILELFKTFRPQGWQILHLAGRDHGETVRKAYRDLSTTAPIASRVIDFTPDMADIWAAADLAVSRSGASSCAELTACGVPSVLMPYPFHKDKHQRLNAQVLEEAGAAVLMDDQRDAKKNAEKLRPILQSLLFDANKRQSMMSAAKTLGKPNAAQLVAEAVMGLVGTDR